MLSRRSFFKPIVLAAGTWWGGSVIAACRRPDHPRPADDLSALTLAQTSALLRRRQISPVELTRATLKRIEQLDPSINAFITVASESAMAAARLAEREILRGQWRGPLHGIPIGLKDNIDTAGIRTTAGSALWAERIPREDADVAGRLRRAGSVLIGKLNLDEFAFGHTSTVSHFGAVHNPWRPDHITGGSSGGSAAAVAARLCHGALGTDTGGSIRAPAAYCGVVGLRPTRGLVSTRGSTPLSPSMDTVGPMGRTVRDVALILSAIAADGVSTGAYVKALDGRVAGRRVGVARAQVSKIDDPEIRSSFQAALEVFRSLGTEVRDLDLPDIPQGTFGKVLLHEAYRFHAPMLEKAADRYHPVVRQRAEAGAAISAETYHDARRDLERLQRGAMSQFADLDVVLAPVAYVGPPTIEQSEREHEVPPRWATADFSVYGLPTLAIPCGFSRSGLPIGLQVAGAPHGERILLGIAHAYEQATTWHTRAPGTDTRRRTP